MTFDFLVIEKTFNNKKDVTFEFMVKSQFLFNFIWYFSKKLQKSASHFSRIFPNISQSTRQKSTKISLISILRLFHRLASKKKKKIDFLEIEKTFENKKGAIFEFMVKSQFLFNSIGYFLKQWQKSTSRFSRI